MIDITNVRMPDDISVVARLAQEIWHQHFTPIIGAEQVEYMLEKFQSKESITGQIESGWVYYLAHVNGKQVGYTALVPDRGNRKLMISKFYVFESEQGHGVGHSVLNFIKDKCRAESFDTLWLTVNRHNLDTITWYEKRGFAIVDEVKKDIGSGFVMDDYIMEKKLT